MVGRQEGSHLLAAKAQIETLIIFPELYRRRIYSTLSPDSMIVSLSGKTGSNECLDMLTTKKMFSKIRPRYVLAAEGAGGVIHMFILGAGVLSWVRGGKRLFKNRETPL
jgi:hypothetical protein